MRSQQTIVHVVVALVGILCCLQSSDARVELYNSRVALRKSSRVASLVGAATMKEQAQEEGKSWALLIAGSHGYDNYRHQADVCHAYQVLKKGGLKDENIVVFMYDDIAQSEWNPKPGMLFNKPDGDDVYAGVPKDYTGEQVNAKNFYAALLGNRSDLTGGSGKVIDSNQNDHVFVYYSDHGAWGTIGMPSGGHAFADDVVATLRKKHANNGFKSLTFYLESCESGSIFSGRGLEKLNIYATTAANDRESSFAAYCAGADPAVPRSFDTCLGDAYSVHWMEDAEVENRHIETLHKQFELVKNKTFLSHVQEFGNVEKLGNDTLDEFMGADPEFNQTNTVPVLPLKVPFKHQQVQAQLIQQRDADVLHYWSRFIRAREGSREKLTAQRELAEILAHRQHVDSSVEAIGELLLGERGANLLQAAWPTTKSLADGLNCLKEVIRAFEKHCGSLHYYGMRHNRAFQILCNSGLNATHLGEAAAKTCTSVPASRWSSLERGYSA